MDSSGEYIAKLKDNLTCPLCHELYDHHGRAPKGLPCMHSLCLQCLDSYVTKTLSEKLRCPMCQDEFKVPSTGIPTNTGLKNMLDLLPKEKHNEEMCARSVCAIHGNKEHMFICQACKVGLCTFCISGLKDGPHKEHELQDYDKAFDNLIKGAKQKAQEVEVCYEKLGSTRTHVADGAKK